MYRLAETGTAVNRKGAYYSDKLQELWPDAKGTSRVTVTETLSENGNSGFSTQILQTLDAGHPVSKVAKMNNLPEIVVWHLKLESPGHRRHPGPSTR